MEKKEVSLQELELVSGGLSENSYRIWLSFYEGNFCLKSTKCIGAPDISGANLRKVISREEGVPEDKIHIYLPWGAELNYGACFADNKIKADIVLKVVIG